MKLPTLLKKIQVDHDKAIAANKADRAELKRLKKLGIEDGRISYKLQGTNKDQSKRTQYARFISPGGGNVYIGRNKEKLEYYEAAIKRMERYREISEQLDMRETQLNMFLTELESLYRYSLPR